MITSIDVQNRLIDLLSADATVQGLFVNLPPVTDPVTAPTFNPILVADPTKIDEPTNIQLAVDLMQEGDDDATLGRTQFGGRNKVTLTFGLMVYVFDDNRNPARKQLIQSVTSGLRMAVMRYSAANSVDGSLQLWYETSWRKTGSGAVTTYFTDNGKRLSVSLLDVIVNQRYV